MHIIYNKIFLEHDVGDHPENKKRLEVFSDLKEQKIINGEKYLELVHSKEYISCVKNQDQDKLKKFLDLETMVSKESYKVACFAVGASIEAAEKGDFALIRPPGHHAGINTGAGFCLFNNIAIISKKLVNTGKKVLIFDFDGHFGHGTAEIFYNSKDVLYFSIHQYPAYPGKGNPNEVGKDEGEGYTINIPLPPKSGDDLFIQSIKDFLPIMEQFNPDAVAVSAGFDGHYADPLLELNYSMNSFYKIGKILSNNFGNIFAVLEGGYNLNFLPRLVYNFIAGVNQEEIKFKEKENISNKFIEEEYNKRMKRLKKILSNYWKL